jgi:hypothetical protein
MDYQRRQGRDTRPGDVLMVVHDFDARSSDELTLLRGDRISLVELDDGFGDGWYLGKHLGSGAIGLFPGVYTTKLPAGLPNLRLNGSNARASLPSESSALQPSHSNQSSQDNRHMSFPSPPAVLSHQAGNASAYRTSMQLESQNAVQASDSNRTAPVAVASASSLPDIQRSINETIGHSRAGQDSPVMNETLSVIEEHITDLSTPRHSLGPQHASEINDSESEYSSHLDSHQSEARGHGSVDEGGDRLTEGEVNQWTPSQTAEHLRRLGVDQKHCDIFEEQEITGDVLLEMDQHFIYMKEYDFGPMGRRLKTWHKIREFQEEVKGVPVSRQTTSAEAGNTSSESLGQNRDNISSSEHEATFPRMPSLRDTPALKTRHSRQNTDQDSMPTPLRTQSNASLSRTSTNQTASPSTWRASMGPDSPSRPSAASIREYNHSRRHSSLDTGSLGGFDPPGSTIGSLSISHKKQSSFDREWSMSTASPRLDTMGSITSPFRLSTILQETNDQSSDQALHVDPSLVDLDRGYFSGGELENRRSKNVLRKRDSPSSPVHSRVSSIVEVQKPAASAPRRHSRMSSADSVGEFIPMITSPASKAYHSNSFKGRLRSSSARAPMARVSIGPGTSPTVTNLEEERTPSVLLPSPLSAQGGVGSFSPLPAHGISNKARKIMGLRAISDSVTGSEKSLVTPTSNPSPVKDGEVQSPARTGSSTPSVASKSVEIDNTDTSSKGTDGPVALTNSRALTRPRAKSKKETSAYTRGLLKLSPAEQRTGCDHSGWMKKKSSSLVTTWKPRLFILRGRRLSYYYSEDDKEERGVIDISSHKVLVANQDPITTLHATITGATSTATPPSNDSSSNLATEKGETSSRTSMSSIPFYFKLVPPKTGLSRAVQFTKPTVHYFQVDSLAEGRKWMGEILKATIEHSMVDYETTNKQKTISLAKARARKERPPALKEAELARDTKAQDTKDGYDMKETGLNIQGLGLDDVKGQEESPNSGHKTSSLNTHQKSPSWFRTPNLNPVAFL